MASEVSRFSFGSQFVQSVIDPCLFFLYAEGRVVVALVIFVDDLFCAGEKDHLVKTEALINKLLPVGAVERTAQANLTQRLHYTGREVEFCRDEKGGELKSIRVTLETYVKTHFGDEFIHEFQPKSRGPTTLLTPAEVDWYRTGLGRSIWASNCDPCAAFAVSEASSASQAPNVAAAKKLVKMMQNIRSRGSKGILLSKLDPLQLMAVLYGDGSFGNAGAKTQGGHAIFLVSKKNRRRGNLAAWLSATLKRVCTSTFDAETLSILRGADEQVCIAFVVSEFLGKRTPSIKESALLHGFGRRPQPQPMIPMLALTDSDGLEKAVQSSKIAIKSKRRRIDLAALRELEEEVEGEEAPGSWTLRWIATDQQVADPLTKEMGPHLLEAAVEGALPAL